MMIRRTVYAAALVAGLALATGCQKATPEATESAEPTPVDPNVLTLSSAAVEKAELGFHVVKAEAIQQPQSFPGEVRAVPERLASVVARLEGIVTRVAIKEGDRVKQGAALVTIQSRKLAEAKLAYLEAEHRLDFSREALKRETKLVDKGISSKEAYQKVAHEREEAELAHAAALQRLKSLGFSEARLHGLIDDPNQEMMSYTLVAPFAGEVISKTVTTGQAVMEDQTLFGLADLSELLVEIKVPMKSVAQFEKGAKVRAICEAIGLETEGTVSAIASIAEAETRTIVVKVTIANPDSTWRPGMPASVELAGAKQTKALAVPLSAIHDLRGKSSVFVRTGPSTFKVVNVTLGAKDDRVQAITAGLAAGDEVVVENGIALKAEWLRSQGE